ncbi:MAG: sigma-54 dependent transcriptional regulator [Myxococcota bacterium]|nr:sigma-54 dependent transcriptional regulator [Myxococcota bacterium]
MGSIHTIVWIGPGQRFAAEFAAENPGVDVIWEGDMKAALKLPLHQFDAIVVDSAGAKRALDDLEKLAECPRLPPILVRLEAPAPKARASLIERGAEAVVECGDGHERDNRALFERLGSLLESARPTAEETGIPSEVVGHSQPMQEVFALVGHASRSQVTVLITGETGTGKELLARAVHMRSRRSRQPFVAINCAAFPETLLESELFGYTKGAFTGADHETRGLFERANRGTLFLDEIAETSAAFQAKLLRVLQEREVRAIGGARPKRIDVRVVAATNRDLRSEALHGRFREDLYYRLAVFPIHLPPLRERRADIIPLATHFLALHGNGPEEKMLDPEAEHLLQSHHWPGNVRELENEIQRALAIGGSPVLSPDHFSEQLTTILEPVEATFLPGESLRETMGRIEAWILRQALASNGGQRSSTARGLGITREGLYKKMKRFGIE